MSTLQLLRKADQTIAGLNSLLDGREQEITALRQQLEEAQRKYEYRDSILAEILAAVLGPSFVPESGFDAAVERIDDRLTELLAAEQRLANAGAREAVAWGIPNSRPTERNPLMRVLLDTTSCQYPELLIPLYLHPAPPATDERVKELEALIEFIGPALPVMRNICMTAGLTHGVAKAEEMIAALAASKADGKGGEA